MPIFTVLSVSIQKFAYILFSVSTFARLEYATMIEMRTTFVTATPHIYARTNLDCILVVGELFSNCCYSSMELELAESVLILNGRFAFMLALRPVWQFARILMTAMPFANEFVCARQRRGRSLVFLDILRYYRHHHCCLRVFRDMSLSRFSHGALHPLRVGQACEWRRLDYSFLTRACQTRMSHLKKVLAREECFYKWVAWAKASAIIA